VSDERNAWWRIARATVGIAVEAGLRISYSGLEHVPQGGGALLAYNHVSVLDPFGVALGAYRRGRISRFLGVAEVFEHPIRGWGLRQLRMVPLARGKGDVRALDAAIATLRRGGLVAIAPEGTVGDGGALQRGHTGAARIALRSGAPVIPVGLWGTQRRWPKEGFRFGPPLRPSVAVVFGSPVPPDGDPRSRADVTAMTDRIMEALGRQVGAARSRA
jgi:1-acyl-sn-glycerol-3-phosphate acyltransferase